MPRAQANKTYFTYVRGLITEASPLTYPENASVDEDNFDLFRDGSRRPRRGLDFETGFSESGNVSSTQFLSRSHSWFLWRAVSNDGQNNVHVVQQGDTLLIFDADVDVTPTTSETLLTQPTVSPSATNVGDARIEWASGSGFLFGAGASIEPFFMELTVPAGPDFDITDITLQIRDFEGVDDSLAIDARPGSLSDDHDYNLQNQSWFPTQIASYFAAQGVFPSNADVWWEGKDGTEAFVPARMDLQFFGNSRAPRGHFILDAFNKDRDTAIGGGTSLVTEVENNRPSTVAFFAGRPWWGGPGGRVYFNQIIEGVINIGKCYQEADPSSEHISELVPTDGGVILIPEADDIIALRPVGTGLVALARNGAWEISGGDRGFRADEFFVRKITEAGTLGAGAAVQTEAGLFYWSQSGIYGIGEDQTTGFLVAQNISEQTIQTFYIEGSNEAAKATAEGVYDDVQRKIFWYYNSDLAFDRTTDPNNDYNRALVLDLSLNAFSPYTIAELDVQDPQIVLPMLRLKALNQKRHKNLVAFPVDLATNHHFTFAEYSNEEIVDWETLNGTGVPYTAFIETGYEILGDSMRNKEAVYLFMYFERTETTVLTNPIVSQLVANGSFTELESELPRIPTSWTDTGTSALNTSLVEVANPGVVTLRRADAVGFAGTAQTMITTSPTLLHTLRITNGPTALEAAEVRVGTALGLDDILAATAVTPGTNPTLTFTPGAGNTILFIEIRNNGPALTAFVDNVSIFDPGGDSDVILFDKPSGCLVQGFWDWADDPKSGKFTATYQAYKFRRALPLVQGQTFDLGSRVIYSKNALRGTGKALQLRFENEPGKDCHILGWAIPFTGEVVP